MKKWRKPLIAGLTFLAGLYFFLAFIVPPTAPLMTISGVLVGRKDPSITVVNAQGQSQIYDITPDLQVLAYHRDATGNATWDATKFRFVGVDDQVQIKTATEKVVGLKITALNRGTAILIVNGARRAIGLTGSSVVMRQMRTGQPVEIELQSAKVGDTLSIGPNTYFRDQSDSAAQFKSIIETMAIGMGLISLGMVNGRRLIRLEKGWYLSVVFFGSVVLGVATGLFKYYEPGTFQRDFSDTVIMRLITAFGSTIFSLLAFYMASAAYRAFRIKTAEAAVMMASAIIVMLGQTPFGTYLTSWMGEKYQALWLPNIAGWILRVPNTALFRAIVFGVMLGAIATAIRYWFSLERASTGDDS